MLEFALALPVLVLFLIGAAVLGKAAYDAQIVGQSVDEGAKMAVIDRVNDGHAYTMSNDEVLRWIRAASHEADPTVKPEAIVAPSSGGHNPWLYQDNEACGTGEAIPELCSLLNDIKNVASSLPSLAFQAPGCSGTQGNFLRLINPGLETMHVLYHHDAGISVNYSYTVNYSYSFTRYSMFTWPLQPQEAGCIIDSNLTDH